MLVANRTKGSGPLDRVDSHPIHLMRVVKMWVEFVVILLPYFVASITQAATINGQITIPDSDMGWKPALTSMGGAQVRVLGSNIVAGIVPASATAGSFTLNDVPSGPVTLLFEEGVNTSWYNVPLDVFTQASKRVTVDVNADTIDGVTFNLIYHWKKLVHYPAPWGTSEVFLWQAHFVDEQTAFVLFRLSTTPERIELYRTLNRGTDWNMIGQWNFDQTAFQQSAPYPAWWLSYYFSDADHGAVLASSYCIPCGSCGAGYYYTSDGGEHWNLSGLPLTPTGYAISPNAYAKIDNSHWIMTGTVGCGVQGYSQGFYDGVWESPDSGASWSLVWNSSVNQSGGFIGVDANTAGRAVGFRGGPIQEFLLRDEQGGWSSRSNDNIYNASRDIAMVGDTAWIVNLGNTVPTGTYQTVDAGKTWNFLSGGAPQDFDFATQLKGFSQAGGPALVTYDSGVTWRYQSVGGAIWPGPMNVWAFDAAHAAWAEVGTSYTGSQPQLYTYVEPWEPNFEILTQTAFTDADVNRGTTDVPMASLRLYSQGPVPIQINNLTLLAAGTGQDATDISAVKLWWDKNANGALDPTDTQIASSTFDSDNGTASLSEGSSYPLEQFTPFNVLVTYDLSADIRNLKTFQLSVAPEHINAQTGDTSDPVVASAPIGTTLLSRTITVPAYADLAVAKHRSIRYWQHRRDRCW